MIKPLFALAAFTAASAANAHYLWIEQPASGNAIVHFGEYNEGVIEHSPGRMDEMPSIEAAADGTGLTVGKAANHYTLSARAGKTAITVSENDYPVKDWRANGIGIAKPMFYARFGIGATAPSLDLDIMPAPDGASAQVFLHGKPLASAAYSLHAPNGWSKSDKADKDGRIALSRPWRGQYLVEVIALEKTPGSYGGVAYEVVRHRATLTVIQPRGPATFGIAAAEHHD